MRRVSCPVRICVMRRHDADMRPGLGDAIQLSDERHDVGHMLEDVTANYPVEFIVREWIRQGAEVVNNIGVCFGICIETDRARGFVPAAAHVKNFPAGSYGRHAASCVSTKEVS